MATTTKYNSVVTNLGRGLPVWVSDVDDQVRVAAYDGYDDMYKNVPGTFALSMRGAEDKPIYVPSAARIIEATNRYLGKDWSWTVTSLNQDAQTAEAQRLEVEMALHALFIREEIASKLFSLKRHMLERGDALWHISLNGLLPEGFRISISEIHPRSFFRIHNANNVEQLTGCYIVELIYADDGVTQIARRQEYRFQENGAIFTKLTFWEPNAWDDRWTGHPALKAVATPTAFKQDPGMADLLSGFELPSTIKALPLYHFRNKREGGEPFGTSQIAGIETLIAAINQTVSDEDITLALQGLGVYVTDSTPPVDEEGAETSWEIAPGVVMEVKPGTKFERMAGVSTVLPFQEHLGYLGSAMDQSVGLSATAVGNVDVAVAASGVALRLDMAPILAQNEEKEVELLGRLDQLFYDLMTMWMPLDGTTIPPGIVAINSFGDPLPVDRQGIITEVTTLVAAGLMSKEFAIAYLSAKLGFQFPDDMLETMVAEVDPAGDRIIAEANAPVV